MKIAFLNDVIYSFAFESDSRAWPTGGAERQQWLLARAMAARGWNVTVGIRNPRLPPREERYVDGVKFLGLDHSQIFVSWCRFFRSERPDWWFWQCASHLFGFGVAAAHAAGVKVVFGVGLDRDVRPREALYRRERWWPAYAFGLSRADRIVLQHEGQRADLPKRWSHKASVVPNITFESQAVTPHAARSTTIAWIAALRQVKRPDLLIALARLVPQARFVVCGSPATYMTPPGYSARMIEAFRTVPNIDYLGQVSPADAVRISATAALLLSTSDEEGFPQTFLEAWAHGTPVVSLKIDPDQVITRFGLGSVCPDLGQAAAEINRLVADVDAREALSRNTRRYVASAHSPDAAVAALQSAMGITEARVVTSDHGRRARLSTERVGP